MPDKKFKDTKVGKFLKEKLPEVAGSVGNVLPDQGVLGIVRRIVDGSPELSAQDKMEFDRLAIEAEKDAQLEAAGIANSLDQKTYLLAARKDAREQIKSKGYDDLANVPDATVINLGYKGEDRKSKYLSDLEEAIFTRSAFGEERLKEKQRKLLDTL